MLVLTTHQRASLRRWLVCSICAFSTSGCVLLLPLFEPDEHAKQMNSRYDPPSGVISTPVYSVKPKIKSSSEKRLTVLIGKLRDPKPVVRINAASQLGDMGPKAEPAVDQLIVSLRDNHYWVRRASVKALGKIGSPRAIPALQVCLNDRNKYVAMSAHNAVGQITRTQARGSLR